MKEFSRRFFVLLTALLLALGVCALAACNDNTESGKTTYSVVVTMPDDSPVAGVKVTWKKYSAYEATTDAAGRASITLPTDEYEIGLDLLPSGYTYAPVKADASRKDVEIVLEEKTIEYTVTVLYPDGKGVENVRLELCVTGNSGMCIPFPDPTNAEGKTSCKIPENKYHAKILAGLPDGFTYEQDGNGYYTEAEATPDSPSLVLQLKAADGSAS